MSPDTYYRDGVPPAATRAGSQVSWVISDLHLESCSGQPSHITNSLLAIDYAPYPCFLSHCSPAPGEGKIIIFIVPIRKRSLEIFTSLPQTSASKWQVWDLDPAVWRLSAL